MKRLLIPCMALSAILFACNSPESTNTTTDSADTAVNTNTDTTTMVDHDDDIRNDSADNSEDFITDAAAGAMMEVRLGELAKTNAASKAVKDFAAMMVSDHSKASEELKSIAAKNNVTIPATLPDKSQKHIDDLSKKSGSEFDKDYISLMVDDQRTISGVSNPLPVWKVERIFTERLLTYTAISSSVEQAEEPEKSPPKLPIWKVNKSYVFYDDGSDDRLAS